MLWTSDVNFGLGIGWTEVESGNFVVRHEHTHTHTERERAIAKFLAKTPTFVAEMIIIECLGIGMLTFGQNQKDDSRMRNLWLWPVPINKFALGGNISGAPRVSWLFQCTWNVLWRVHCDCRPSTFGCFELWTFTRVVHRDTVPAPLTATALISVSWHANHMESPIKNGGYSLGQRLKCYIIFCSVYYIYVQ